MAQIVVTIDTADKSKSSVTIDGKTLKNVTSFAVYGMEDPTYMGLEIIQFEAPSSDEKGGLRRVIRTSASKESNWKLIEDNIDDTRAELIMFLSSRESTCDELED